MFVSHRAVCLAALALAAAFSGCSEDSAKPASNDVVVADTVDDAAGTTDAVTATDTDAATGSDTSAPKFRPYLRLQQVI